MYMYKVYFIMHIILYIYIYNALHTHKPPWTTEDLAENVSQKSLIYVYY